MKQILIILASFLFLFAISLAVVRAYQPAIVIAADTGFNGQDTLPIKNKGKHNWVDTLRQPDTLYHEHPATPVPPDSMENTDRLDTMTTIPERDR